MSVGSENILSPWGKALIGSGVSGFGLFCDLKARLGRLEAKEGPWASQLESFLKLSDGIDKQPSSVDCQSGAPRLTNYS